MRRNLAMVLLSLILLSGATALLSACNTIAGAGADVSDAGHAVTGDAQHAKPR
jgi:predicted small secreted protein